VFSLGPFFAHRVSDRNVDFAERPFRFPVIMTLTVEPNEWAEAHFFIGLNPLQAQTLLKHQMTRVETIARLTAMAEEAATPAGIEIVEVELKGSGRNHLVRIYIDRPEGVSHADCELVSKGVSAALDAEDPIPGSYDLEVSSPGVERKLTKWQDWLRFSGKKIKVVLKDPVHIEIVPDADGGDGKKVARQIRGDIKSFEGTISKAENHTVTVELAGAGQVTFPVEQVDRANLKFDW
jgi:ribosome maturation factor RimP